MNSVCGAVLPVALAMLLSAAALAVEPEFPPPVVAPPPQPTGAPQRALPEQLRAPEAISHGGMVVTRNAAASWAGARILETGGNAVDAAVAAAFALGVAEPGSCGLGGQSYILLRMADGHAVAIDGSARAPLAASTDELQSMRDEVELTRYANYIEGYKAVATPGSLAALDLARRRYGTKPFAEVLAPAIAIAEYGSTWSAAMRSFLAHYSAKVQRSDSASRLYFDRDRELMPSGHAYCNPELACFLRRLAAEGAESFYRGPIAAEIAGDMATHGGWVQLSDLALLSARELRPVRGTYRGVEVLSFPEPGGGAAVVEALGILDRLDPAPLRVESVDRLHLLVEASRLAVADVFPATRPAVSPDAFAADPNHLAARAALIRLDRALTPAEVSRQPLSTLDVGGTTQVSVVDRDGNAVSITQTLGATFGSCAIADGFGFAYNNMLEGFDFRDRRNRSFLRPRQAPVTAMAPTILVSGGRPLLVLGSAGSARITSVIVDTIVALVDQRLPPCEVISAPRALWGGNADQRVYLEMVDPITDADADELARRGFAGQLRLPYPATAYEMTDFGDADAVFVDPRDGTRVGVADPRRQGVPRAADDGASPEMSLAIPECWRSLWALPGGPP